MTTFADLMPPMFTWAAIDRAFSAIPAARWEAAARFGACEDDAAKVIRFDILHDLKIELEKLARRPLDPATCKGAIP